MGGGTDTPQLAYARDDRFEYLGTPNGLYRAERIANGPLQLIAFGGEAVNAMAIEPGALYVSRGLLNFAGWPQETLLRSRDDGATFEAIASGLRDCITPNDCGYLIPRQITLGPERIFLSAGGNVLVSADDGATWNVLFGLTNNGKPTAQVCPVTYERIGERLIYGGECPLDVGYISAGTLRSDFLGWENEPSRVVTPEIENRNVQFIRDFGDGVVYAGIEGALLVSTDNGSTFDFALHYPLSGADAYPYITQIVASSRHPGLMLIGGFNKANGKAWLASSPDAGKTWADISSLVANASIVSLIAEDADGRLLVGTYEGDRFVISNAVVGEYRKRRAVR